jgi:hypothetical protein
MKPRYRLHYTRDGQWWVARMSIDGNTTLRTTGNFPTAREACDRVRTWGRINGYV